LDEVPPFLFEILRDPNTLQVPAPRIVQDLLARWIAGRRSKEIARQYGEIGGASPIVAATDRLAQKLRETLATDRFAPRIWVAHRYLPGHTRETATRIVGEGVARIIAIPMYPHFSWATTGSAAEQLEEELNRAGYQGEVSVIRSYPEATGYVDAVSARLSETLAQVQGTASSTVILCSAHGLPANYVDAGDPYRFELYRTVDALRRRFPDRRFVLSFQSRVGPAEWLQPYTDRILADLAKADVQHLVFLPIAFVNDHLETLYEIGHTYFAAARQLGMAPYRVPAIEDHPAYVSALAHLVREAYEGRVAVPLREVLPPSQAGKRVGWWLWSVWLAAVAGALANALSR